MNTKRISRRTGRPVRRYDDSLSTTLKALDFDAHALRKLVTKWPQGAWCGREREPWHIHLAKILTSCLAEPPQLALPAPISQLTEN